MKRLMTGAILLLQSTLSFSQDPISKKLDSLFRFYEKEYLFNGSVLVAKKGQLLLNKGYGLMNVAKKQPNTQQGIFQIYSITKTFTSTVILRLIEEGKLSLSEQLSKFYPGFPKGDSITIEHLLTHTSGLYDYTRGNTMPDQTEKSFIEFESKQPLDFPVGTDWSYTNSGYYFLGYITQKITGTTYEQAVSDYIFKPLKMQQSGFAFKNLISPLKTTGYEILDPKIAKPSIIYDPPGPFAAGGIYSTVEDLYKYYNGLKEGHLLKPESLKKAYTAYRNNYGYGWIITNMLGKETVGHSGAGAGYRSNYIQVPSDDICIILLGNSEQDLNFITTGIMKILYGAKFRIPSSKTLSRELLSKYTGAYQVENDFVIYVSLANGKIAAQPSGRPKSMLYPESPNKFYSMELEDYIRFTKNTHQQIDTLIFNRNGTYTKAARINASWGIIGSATPTGWDGDDIILQPSKTKGIYEIRNVTLKEGELKFRLNKDWTVNLGILKGNELIQDGDNIKIGAGVWDIELDARDGERVRYRLIKK